MQIWRLLISINWILSTKEMNPITRNHVKISNTAKLQSCRPNTRGMVDIWKVRHESTDYHTFVSYFRFFQEQFGVRDELWVGWFRFKKPRITHLFAVFVDYVPATVTCDQALLFLQRNSREKRVSRGGRRRGAWSQVTATAARRVPGMTSRALLVSGPLDPDEWPGYISWCC